MSDAETDPKYFSPVREIVSIKSIEDNVSSYSKSGRLLSAIAFDTGHGEPEKICIEHCTLKKPLLHFPIGTKFDEISMNEYCVARFYIKDQAKLCVFDRNGFNYWGSWLPCLEMDVDGKPVRLPFSDIRGRWGFVRGGVITASAGRLTVRDCELKIDAGPFNKGDSVATVRLDIDNGECKFKDGEKKFKCKLLVRFTLKKKEIPMSHIQQAHDEGHISQYDYNDALKHKTSPELPESIKQLLGEEQEEKDKVESKRRKVET